jgi:hypothetical protein
VVRYSGFWSASNCNQNLARLQAALRAADLAWEGEAVVSRCHAPFTSWLIRRNEFWLRLSVQP